MRHYALFRLQEGMPCGRYPIPHAVPQCIYFIKYMAKKIAAFVGDVFRPLEF